ncbi:dsba-like thioredoxin domain-containing protein [Diaporthe eres]|nr:dsba-like thioredoxin domain-containing protein [Diaporthe eres]
MPVQERMAQKFGADKLGNTRDAHRLSQLAKTKGADVQSKLMAALMHSYFEDGGRRGDEVDKAVEWAYAKGIQGVPHFIINDRYEIGGAQDVEPFLGEFVRAKGAAA